MDRKDNLNRLREILRVLSKYQFGYIVEKIKLKHNIPFLGSSYEYESIEELDESTPERLRLVLEELGPTFIKLGQTLSTRPDLVGRDIATELTKLQDDTPQVDPKIIQNVIEEELGAPINEIFTSFNETPLGSASIGQVHKAELKTGEEVAVKVRKPGVEETIKKDIAIMEFLAKRVDRFVPQLKIYNVPGIVEEFKRTIFKEIDYQNEALNIRRFTENFKDDPTVHVPTVYNDFSTLKVITMELIEGTKISEVTEEDGFDLKLIAKRGAISYFKQVADYGFFHADPHPSNIYILDNNVICYIDFGMMGILDNEFKNELSEMILYLVNNDVNGIVNQLAYMGMIGENVDIRSLKYDLTDMMFKYYGSELNEVHGGMNELVDIMHKYNIFMPRELVLLARSIGMVEETGEQLDPSFNAVKIGKPVIQNVVRKKFSPVNFVDYLRKNFIEMEHNLKNIPQAVTKTLYKLEEGEIHIKLDHVGLDRISNKISITIILASLIIGSSLIMTTQNGIYILKYHNIGVVGFLISAVLGLYLVISIIRWRGD